MSGHSKWSTIKRKKGAIDAKRGQVFSKVAKEILVAARNGGGDPAGNISLRSLIQKARSINMPSDSIERAVKKGTGELEGGVLDEIMYEGFAPGGVAVIVEVLTDNRNRTAAEVRHVFTKNNASLGGQGTASRSFQRKGEILVNTGKVDEDTLLEIVLEAGAEDMVREGDAFEIQTDPSAYMTVMEALEKQEIPVESSEVSFVPVTTVEITDAAQAALLLKFVEALEDLDDVQNVYANFDIDDEIAAELHKA